MPALISWRNLIDKPYVALTDESHGGIDPAFPLENLKKRGLADVAKTNGGGNISVVASNMGSQILELPLVVAMLGVTSDGHSSSGPMTIDTSQDGTNWTTHATVYAGELGTDAQPPNLIHVFPRGIDAPPGPNYLRITFTFHHIFVHGFARLWIGPALILPDGVSANWRTGFRDSGALGVTAGQQFIETRGVRTRTLHAPIHGCDTRTAFGFDDGDTEMGSGVLSLQRLQLEAGTTGEVIAVPRTSTPLWARRTAIYGHIDQPWEIEHTAGPYWNANLQIIEER